MRIVHLSNNFFPTTGGIETYVYELASRSVRSGNDVYVVTSDKDPVTGRMLRQRETVDGIKVIRVPFMKLGRYSSSFAALREALSVGPDVIHVHGVGGLSDMIPLMKLAGSKVVVSTHGGIFHTSSARLLKRIYFNVSAKSSLFFADAVIAHSRHDMKTFAEIVMPKKLVLSHYGIDWKNLSSVKRRSDGKTLLYVGRLAKNKRLDRMLGAVALAKSKSPGIRLFLVGGDWGENAMLVDLAKKLGIEKDVVFAGDVPHKDVRKFLARSDVFLLSSEYEGFGISVLEALASGMQVVVNDLGPMSEMVRNGKNGFIVDFQKVNEAADAIAKALRRKTDSKIIRDSVRLFDWDVISKEIDRIYRGL
jgi:alpha-1,3-mannosyltransferase